jgi:hypothetical protein
MKAPMYVRALSPAEQAGIEAGLRSSEAFTLRRSQILLASSREQRLRKSPAIWAVQPRPCAMRSMPLNREA